MNCNMWLQGNNININTDLSGPLTIQKDFLQLLTIVHMFLFLQINRLTTVCGYRTIKCTYMVSEADKMDKECRCKGWWPISVY